jgi:tetratricopeptide (TPR) repeat protein
MKLTLASCSRLLGAVVFLILPLAGMRLMAQRPEYGNPYIPDRSSIQQTPQTGGMEDRVRRNTKVERFIQTADSAIKATPPRYSDAEYALKFALASDPEDTQAYARLGYVYFMQRRYKDAADVYKRGIQVQSRWPEAHFNLGLTYARLNMKKEARRELKTLQGLDNKLADRLAKILG